MFMQSFSSGSNSQMSRDLEISRHRNRIAQWNKDRQIFGEIAKKMVSDFKKTKEAIDTAITSYLNAIENKFFRKEGRNRAYELQRKIQMATNTFELMNALDEVIHKGNENPDSLKTFLFKSMNLNFFNNQIHPNRSYTNFLYSIICAVKSNQEPNCATNLTSLASSKR